MIHDILCHIALNTSIHHTANPTAVLRPLFSISGTPLHHERVRDQSAFMLAAGEG